MYYYHPSQRGSALIIWLVIAVLLTIMTTTFLEKILGLGQTSGGITNSAQSYALATGLIEKQLMDPSMTKNAPWNIATISEGNINTDTGRTLMASTGWLNMPEPWQWNSIFDSDWNIIGMGEPLQIVIPENISWNMVRFYFRVPKTDNTTFLTGASTASWIVLWTFWSSGASLYASGELEIFRWTEIGDIAWVLIDTKKWLTTSGSAASFDNFYTNSTYGVGPSGAKCAGYQCTLKLSMIRPFITQGEQSFPFLEYRIEFPSRIPSQYMLIDSTAYVYGYLRTRQVRIPQITTSTATDFAVLQ